MQKTHNFLQCHQTIKLSLYLNNNKLYKVEPTIYKTKNGETLDVDYLTSDHDLSYHTPHKDQVNGKHWYNAWKFWQEIAACCKYVGQICWNVGDFGSRNITYYGKTLTMIPNIITHFDKIVKNDWNSFLPDVKVDKKYKVAQIQ
jgi:hypothetical protein